MALKKRAARVGRLTLMLPELAKRITHREPLTRSSSNIVEEVRADPNHSQERPKIDKQSRGIDQFQSILRGESPEAPVGGPFLEVFRQLVDSTSSMNYRLAKLETARNQGSVRIYLVNKG